MYTNCKLGIMFQYPENQDIQQPSGPRGAECYQILLFLLTDLYLNHVGSFQVFIGILTG